MSEGTRHLTTDSAGGRALLTIMSEKDSEDSQDSIEGQVEDSEAREGKTNSSLEARVSKLEEQLEVTIGALPDDGALEEVVTVDKESSGSTTDAISRLTRRGALAGLVGLGGLAVGTGNASADTTFGDSVSGSNPNGFGFRAVNNADSGSGFGIQGFTYSPEGRALLGRAEATSGHAWGVLGVSQAPQGRGLQGFANHTTGSNFGLRGRSDSSNGVGISGVAASSSGTTYGIMGEAFSPDGWGIYTPDDAKIGGNLLVEGTKNFVQTITTATGPKTVAYNAVEAGRAHTEVNDVAEMDEGHAIVDLPDHFGMVTSEEENLVVQVTPYAEENVSPQVTHRSTHQIIVEDFGDGPDDYTFAYTVKGIRAGFEDEDIIYNQ